MPIATTKSTRLLIFSSSPVRYSWVNLQEKIVHACRCTLCLKEEYRVMIYDLSNGDVYLHARVEASEAVIFDITV